VAERRFLDVRALYRPEPRMNEAQAAPSRPPFGSPARELQAYLWAEAKLDSAQPSRPATKVLTTLRPKLTSQNGFMASPQGAMTLRQSHENDDRRTREAAYLLLIERAGKAAFRRGPEACSEFVGEVARELTSDDPALEYLRDAAPEVAEAERMAVDMLDLRCEVCPIGSCLRAAR
jgi:hypothetical protein